jgi:hypothetical protein
MEGVATLPFSPVAVVPPTPQAPSAYSGLLSRHISFMNHHEFRWKHRTFHKAVALGTQLTPPPPFHPLNLTGQCPVGPSSNRN